MSKKVKWVDARYKSDKTGKMVMWIIPEGGKKHEGISAAVAKRILDSDTDSLRAVATAMLAASAPSAPTLPPPPPGAVKYWVAVNGTTLPEQRDADGVLKIIAMGESTLVYVGDKWITPEAAGIVKPAPSVPMLPPPPPPAKPDVKVVKGELEPSPATGSSLPPAPASDLKARVMAARAAS